MSKIKKSTYLPNGAKHARSAKKNSDIFFMVYTEKVSPTVHVGQVFGQKSGLRALEMAIF